LIGNHTNRTTPLKNQDEDHREGLFHHAYGVVYINRNQSIH
jgi:hypothetical protein